MRSLFALAALLLAGVAGAEVPQVVRDSVHDWRCVDAEYNLISNHQRQDRAIVVCQEQAEAHPGEIFYIEGGRYRVIVAAAPTPDPVPEPDPAPDPIPDPDSVPDPDPAPDGVAYDLSGYSIPFAYEWPAAPRIASEATVTPATLSANNVNGRRLTLSAGDYGNVSSRSDQEWVLQPGALINRFDFTGSQRVKVTCEVPRDCRIGQFHGDANGVTSDIHFDEVYQSNGPWSDFAVTWNAPAGIRVAITNSSLNCGSYCLFAASPNSDWWNNLIVAGNYIRSANDVPMGVQNAAQHTIRLMQPNTFIFVGNYIVKGSTGMIFRVHTNDSPSLDAFDGYVADNVLVGEPGYTYYGALQIYPASSGYTPSNLVDLTYDRNEIHLPSGGAVAFDTNTWNRHIIRPTVTNTTVYGSLGYFSESMFVDATFSNNVQRPYSTSTVPAPASKLGWTP